jgi:two-component system, NarL family, nitrate/nitrite response regulator NarL
MSPPSRVAVYRRAGPLRVAILSEDALLRAALARALEGDELASADRDAAQVALWDWGTLARPADAAAIELRLASLRAEKIPVVALVPTVAAGQEALGSGAKAVLLREKVGAHLVSALFAAHAGLTVLDQAFAARYLGKAPYLGAERAEAHGPNAEQLTAREREVIALIAEGLSNKRIARRLGISEHTAKFHVNRILEKLGADTRTEAVVRAMRHGMLMV